MIMCFSPDQRISIDVNNILELISSIIVISSTFHIGLTKTVFHLLLQMVKHQKGQYIQSSSMHATQNYL